MKQLDTEDERRVMTTTVVDKAAFPNPVRRRRRDLNGIVSDHESRKSVRNEAEAFAQRPDPSKLLLSGCGETLVAPESFQVG